MQTTMKLQSSVRNRTIGQTSDTANTSLHFVGDIASGDAHSASLNMQVTEAEAEQFGLGESYSVTITSIEPTEA